MPARHSRKRVGTATNPFSKRIFLPPQRVTMSRDGLGGSDGVLRVLSFTSMLSYRCNGGRGNRTRALRPPSRVRAGPANLRRRRPPVRQRNVKRGAFKVFVEG